MAKTLQGRHFSQHDAACGAERHIIPSSVQQAVVFLQVVRVRLQSRCVRRNCASLSMLSVLLQCFCTMPWVAGFVACDGSLGFRLREREFVFSPSTGRDDTLPDDLRLVSQ